MDNETYSCPMEQVKPLTWRGAIVLRHVCFVLPLSSGTRCIGCRKRRYCFKKCVSDKKKKSTELCSPKVTNYFVATMWGRVPVRATALSSGLCVVINGQPARSLMPDAVLTIVNGNTGVEWEAFLRVLEKRKNRWDIF